MSPRIIVLTAGLILTAPVDLLPQEDAPRVAPGDRVLVLTTASRDPYPCTLQAVNADTLVLAAEGQVRPLVLPLADVTRLEVSRGMKSRAFTGARWGFGIGGLIGMGIGYYSTDDWDEAETQGLLGALLGGVAGAVVGGLVGSTMEVERWEEVPIDRLRVSVGTDGGLSVRSSIRF